MRTENIKVELIIPIPIDKQDKNGIVYTKDAIENAVNNLRKNIPIIYADNEDNKKVVGVTTDKSHIVTWDYENQVCNMTVDGVIFYGGAEIIVNDIDENYKISDFEIISIGLTK